MRNKKLTRKEVAELIGVSGDSVRRNEKRWGLLAAKVQANARLIWYIEGPAIEALRTHKLIP